MKNFKTLIINGMIILITSASGFFLFAKISQNLKPLKKVSQTYRLVQNKKAIDDLRYRLLYQNQNLKKLADKLNIKTAVFANNLKLKANEDCSKFILEFTFNKHSSAKQIVQAAQKIIAKENSVTIQPQGNLTFKNAELNNGQNICLIGLITGFFLGVGCVSFYRKKRSIQ